MAMRPRGGSASGSKRTTRTGLVRPVYEDFNPVSEWQQDDESHILNIYLPGFMKEQIKVTTEGRNTIRVRGERLVAGNKWSRFVEDFQVPENGEMNSVRAKFHGGILSLTVPKERVGKPQIGFLPPEPLGVDDIRKQPTPQKGQVKATREVVSPATDVKGGLVPQDLSNDPETTRGQDGNQKQPVPQKGLDKALPAVDTSQSTEEKSLQPLKALEAEKRESSESKEKHVASEKQDEVTKEKVHKEVKETVGSSELPEAKTIKTKKLDKIGATGNSEKNADNKELYGASKKQKHKKAITGLTELNEERQLLVNMGVAMLVIVALTAFVTYNFASANHKN
ncbi:hypothetical protein C2S51_032442 [Perilla frutescens var. frutescens]|nr:hypothetical protein C2S51_032442 [Perilla frutescens var. frutescens]